MIVPGVCWVGGLVQGVNDQVVGAALPTER